jgi:hypothetical protein
MGGDFCRSPESLNLSFSLCVWCAQLVFGSARGGGGMGTQGTISIQLDKQLANAEGTGEQIMRRVRVCARARQLPHSQPATKGGGPSHLILTHRLAVCVRACVRACVRTQVWARRSEVLQSGVGGGGGVGRHEGGGMGTTSIQY